MATVIPLPTSPFIVNPFVDALVIPQALAPGWRSPDGTLAPDDPLAWSVRETAFAGAIPTGDPDYPFISRPGPGVNQQDSIGFVAAVPGVSPEHSGQHQVWPNASGQNSDRLTGLEGGPYPDPILYHIRVQLAEHSFTSSSVRPITALGTPVAPENLPDGVVLDSDGTTSLPMSTMYTFNGTFPGPMINAEYGKPTLVRFENDLDLNPLGLDRQDFGDPEWKSLTHLHNAHTAPESDGNPFYMQQNGGGYLPGQWADNLYLNYPAGGDPNEKQSFFWYHDHTMHHTGENVYKGLVGLNPIYDPKLDPGDERDPGVDGNALHLPGIKTIHENGSFDVKYDIPMAFYDTMLDDGTTIHHQLHGAHQVDYPFPDHIAHPEWWGKSFYAHDPDLGFVGDIFTVNGTAFPVLHVDQRQYRFRFLDASVSRIYELSLMTSENGPVAMPGTQGQWQIPDGELWKPMTQIASMGGLLPETIQRDSIQIWPATRNEHIVDFSDAPAGTVIYLTNILYMANGRKPEFLDPEDHVNLSNYKVPMVKIVVDGPPPIGEEGPSTLPRFLRPMPSLPPQSVLDNLPKADFLIARSGNQGPLNQWQINNLPFDPLVPLRTVTRGQPEVWRIINGGGGWVHPMHFHMEEHVVLSRDNSTSTHPDDTGRSDTVNLEENETVTIYRNFRTFTGRYVGHCHNLLHEDHSMMFGFTVLAEPEAPVPDAPSNLQAIVQPGPAVHLTWIDHADNETGFVIERLEGGIIIEIGRTTADSQSFTDNSAQLGHTYTYAVKAFNDAGFSVYSNLVTSIIPLGLPTSPNNLQATLLSGPRVHLTWTDRADNETGFVIERRQGTSTVVFDLPGANIETFADNTVLPGRSYSYEVRAVNELGSSAPTIAVVVAVPSVPTAPTNLRAKLTATRGIELSFRDNSTNESGFVVERAVNGGAFVAFATLPAQASTRTTVFYTDDSVRGNNTYAYRVAAIHGVAGSSAYSNTASIIMPPIPPPPTNFAGQATFSARLAEAIIDLQWGDIVGNTGYVVELSTDSNFTSVTTFNRGTNATGLRITALRPGTTYYVRIKSTSAYGDSDWRTLTLTTPTSRAFR